MLLGGALPELGDAEKIFVYITVSGWIKVHLVEFGADQMMFVN